MLGYNLNENDRPQPASEAPSAAEAPPAAQTPPAAEAPPSQPETEPPRMHLKLPPVAQHQRRSLSLKKPKAERSHTGGNLGGAHPLNTDNTVNVGESTQSHTSQPLDLSTKSPETKNPPNCSRQPVRNPNVGAQVSSSNANTPPCRKATQTAPKSNSSKQKEKNSAKSTENASTPQHGESSLSAQPGGSGSSVSMPARDSPQPGSSKQQQTEAKGGQNKNIPQRSNTTTTTPKSRPKRSKRKEKNSADAQTNKRTQKRFGKVNRKVDRRTPDELTAEDLERVALKESDKKHNKETGTSCHQCRQKTEDQKTICRSNKCKGSQGMFCGKCLMDRYKEDAKKALMDWNWKCPVCRGICNCSICRTKAGKSPTGRLKQKAKKEGYGSARHYIEDKEKGENSPGTDSEEDPDVETAPGSKRTGQPSIGDTGPTPSTSSEKDGTPDSNWPIRKRPRLQETSNGETPVTRKQRQFEDPGPDEIATDAAAAHEIAHIKRKLEWDNDQSQDMSGDEEPTAKHARLEDPIPTGDGDRITQAPATNQRETPTASNGDSLPLNQMDILPTSSGDYQPQAPAPTRMDPKPGGSKDDLPQAATPNQEAQTPGGNGDRVEPADNQSGDQLSKKRGEPDETIWKKFKQKQINLLYQHSQRFGHNCTRKAEKIQASTSLTSHSLDDIRVAYVDLRRFCKERLEDYQDGKINDPTYKLKNIKIDPRILQREIHRLAALDEAMTDAQASGEKIEIPAVEMNETLRKVWTRENDINLLEGIYQHGMHSWDLIKKDATLNLEDKLNQFNAKQARDLLCNRANILIEALNKRKGVSNETPDNVHMIMIQTPATSTDLRWKQRPQATNPTPKSKMGPVKPVIIHFGLQEDDAEENFKNLKEKYEIYNVKNLVLPEDDTLEVPEISYHRQILAPFFENKPQKFFNCLVSKDRKLVRTKKTKEKEAQLVNNLIRDITEKFGKPVAEIINQKLVLWIDERHENWLDIASRIHNHHSRILQKGEQLHPNIYDNYMDNYEGIMRRQRKRPQAGRPVFMSSQRFVAERILARIQMIQNCNLKKKYKKFVFQIYTPRATMLVNQTRNRAARPDAGCFSIDIMQSPQKLRAEVEKCVKILLTHTASDKTPEAIKRHEELMEQAKNEKDTFFLIIADEAHWGATGGKSTAENEVCANDDQEPKETNIPAYKKLVNSWTDKDHPNVFVLLVSATPYNLLTKDTQLCDTKCIWDGEKQAFRGLTIEDGEHSQIVCLHHIKWDELMEYDIQTGINRELKFVKDRVGFYVRVDEEGWIQAESDHDNLTVVNFTGLGSHSVRITAMVDKDVKKTLAVVKEPDNNRGPYFVRFLPEDQLPSDPNLYNFKMTSDNGQDVFYLETQVQDKTFIITQKGRKVGQKENFMACFKDTGDKIDVLDCFHVYSNQPIDTVTAIDEYASLNFYFNSCYNNQEYDRYIRADNEFEEVVEALKANGIGAYDTLAAEYTLHVLNVYEMRKWTLKERNLEKVLHDLFSAGGEYTAKRDGLIQKFEDKLEEMYKADGAWMRPDHFQLIVDQLEARYQGALIRNIKELEPEKFLSSLMDCLLFLREDKLKQLQEMLIDLLFEPSAQEIKVKEMYEELYERVCEDFKRFDVGKKLIERIRETESCRIIQDLVVEEDDMNPLHGPMKIVRMTTKTGNQLYNMLCVARDVISNKSESEAKPYTFEIVRDYDIYDLSQVNNNPNSASYRIHQALQCRECTHVDEAFQSCNCNEYKRTSEKDLKCQNCHHVHTDVKDYADLKDLPCIVILVGKGRMGDTFPDSFNAMDLRASTYEKTTTKGILLTPLVQEIGRLCRYIKKSNKDKIPYVLLGKGLGKHFDDKMKDRIATFFSGYKDEQKDLYIDSNNRVIESHADYKSKQHRNRILLEAEPQVGKTGTYLCLVSLLRELIEGDQNEVETEEETEEFETDESDTRPQETAEKEDETWQRPNHTKMDQDASQVKRVITQGKYVAMFGHYVYGNGKPEMLIKTDDICKRKTTIVCCKKKEKGSEKLKLPIKYKAYPANAPCHVTKLRGYGNHHCQITVAGMKVNVSLPTGTAYRLIYTKFGQEGSINSNSLSVCRQSLETWIFTPSYNRCQQATLNYGELMTDDEGKPVNYIHCIVVRPEDYDQYVKQWGFTHAIIKLPTNLPDIEEDVAHGGVGFARRFILLLAQKYKLPNLFMLDDNIEAVHEVITERTENGDTAVRENGKYCFESVTLFKVLKDMENQRLEESGPAPLQRFTPCTDTEPGTQESFTGPWSKYGIVGVRRRGKHVFSNKHVRPFLRTHVMALTLVNVEALAEKDLLFKPWPVWEDLEMNNQCDEQGLWVVKYNKYIIKKAYAPSWLPKFFPWRNSTEMAEKTDPGTETNCVLSLRRFITQCLYIRKVQPVITSQNEVAPVSKCVLDLHKSIREQKLGCTLLSVADAEVGTDRILASVTASVAENPKEGVVLVLPSLLCWEKGWRTINSLCEVFQPHLPSQYNYKFDVVTSVDVSIHRVQMVLVYIHAPKEKKASNNGQSTSNVSQATDSKPCERVKPKLMETDDGPSLLPLSETKAPGAATSMETEVGETSAIGDSAGTSQVPPGSHQGCGIGKKSLPTYDKKDLAPGDLETPAKKLRTVARREDGADCPTRVDGNDLNTSINSSTNEHVAAPSNPQQAECELCKSHIAEVTAINRLENNWTLSPLLNINEHKKEVIVCQPCKDGIYTELKKRSHTFRSSVKKHGTTPAPAEAGDSSGSSHRTSMPILQIEAARRNLGPALGLTSSQSQPVSQSPQSLNSTLHGVASPGIPSSQPSQPQPGASHWNSPRSLEGPGNGASASPLSTPSPGMYQPRNTRSPGMYRSRNTPSPQSVMFNYMDGFSEHRGSFWMCLICRQHFESEARITAHLESELREFLLGVPFSNNHE